MGFLGDMIGRAVGRVVFTGAALGGAHTYMNANGPAGASGAAGPLGGISAILAAQNPAAGAASNADRKAATSHYIAQARITGVSTQCRLKQTVDGRMRRTEIMPCGRAALLVKDPRFAGYELDRSRHVDYIYYSKDGTDVIEASYDPRRTKTGGVAVGDVIDIRVEHKNPRSSQPI